jgi:hypothetical protein
MFHGNVEKNLAVHGGIRGEKRLFSTDGGQFQTLRGMYLNAPAPLLLSWALNTP